jgi:hypothetical protein
LRAAAIVLLASVVACPGPGTHVLLGHLYEASRDCVDPTSSIDIVDGPEPGSGCPPTCVVTPAGQNGGGVGVYVTTTCGPYPPLDDTTGAPAGCADALAAFARSDVCTADGQSTSPLDGSSSGEGGLGDAPAE